MAGRRSTDRVVAWRPAVPGVVEVLHASFLDHAYPSHTHDSWTLLLVDDGVVRYDLDRRDHGAWRSVVTLLPPGVPHDGRSWTPAGFRKRVLYLDADALGPDRTGAAADRPSLQDAALRAHTSRLHRLLADPVTARDALEAESRLALVVERLRHHLTGVAAPHGSLRTGAQGDGTADRLRELIDARVVEGITLAEASRHLGAAPTTLLRAFTRRHGIPPHRYLTGRRIDLARRLLLSDVPAAHVATAVGFHDQAHLTRHFRRMLATTPAAYASSARRSGEGRGAAP